MRKTILVTGASGFIGSTLLAALAGREVRRALRRPSPDANPGDVVVGEIGAFTDWHSALSGVDCVIHLAARTHVLRENSTKDAINAYRNLNVEGTRRLALQAAECGVRRFILVSSIKVNGERTFERAFTAGDVPQPQDHYGISKLESENILQEIAMRRGMEWVVMRPPLVYGAGVKGNLLQMLRALDFGCPMPFASVSNKRSMINVLNLADALIAAIDVPAAAGRVWLISDGEDVSTPDLIRKLAAGLGKPARLFPFPVALLQLASIVAGKQDSMARLTESLVVNCSDTREILGWAPRISLDQGLIDTARWYHQRHIQLGRRPQ